MCSEVLSFLTDRTGLPVVRTTCGRRVDSDWTRPAVEMPGLDWTNCPNPSMLGTGIYMVQESPMGQTRRYPFEVR